MPTPHPTAATAPATPDTAIVWAVIVAYQPDLRQLDALMQALAPQVTGIVLIDNSPDHKTGDNDSAHDGLVAWITPRLTAPTTPGHAILRYRPMPHNVGVAAGHNAGIAAARAENATHVILFDQDSVPAPDMVARLQDAFADATARGLRVASAGPRYHDPRDGVYYPFIRACGWGVQRLHQPEAGHHYCRADYLITSGCLIPLAVIDDIGAMEDDLFIDYIDIEWGLRAVSRGYTQLGVFNAEMAHLLGDPPGYYFGGRLRVPMHSPLRHYYHFRNALLLYQRPQLSFRWRCNDAFRLLRKVVFYSLFTSNAKEQRGMIMRGLSDGFRRKTGAYRLN